ncbi:MAG: hypothetical protein CVV64_03640 [Candidatus Wallbacteria bacterium HGW-Wallbacteria-1]|jgi:tetratricopeptide (TPR) repeat protein|uniref:O-antigen ligase-related domain-containing protein n=1 Tax=Candidatus Wallbacteria bacterium HGW-Wallbacteria-1 TaxID=2013854 RepID=A0A2N1PTU3_9BACT|nr:MAG: hypothetical protein CVV64_03640 [Candidatus Wallbacteria bacterium HGW-Wallbacteria-1]
MTRKNGGDSGAQWYSGLERIFRLALMITVAVVPLTFSRWTHSSFLLPKETVSCMMAILLAVIWAIRLTLYPVFSEKGSATAQSFFSSPVDLPAICILVYLSISLPFSSSPYLCAGSLARLALFLVMFRGTMAHLNSVSWTRRIMTVAVVVVALTSIVGTLEAFDIRFLKWSESAGRLGIISTYGNPNYVAGTMIAVLPAAISLTVLAIREGNVLLSGLMGLSSMSIGLLVFLTQTRGSWLGFICASMLSVGLLLEGRGSGRALKRGITGIVAALLLTSLFLGLAFDVLPGRDRILQMATERLSSLTGKSQGGILNLKRIFTSDNFLQRALVWHGTIQMVADHPILGVGLGAFKYQYLVYQGKITSQERYSRFARLTGRANQTHNEYLQIWAETGTVGVFLFGWLGFVFFRVALERCRLFEDREAYHLHAGALASVFGVSIHALVSFPFHLASTSTIFVIFAGIACRRPTEGEIVDKDQKFSDSGCEVPTTSQRYGALLLAVLGLIALWLAVKPLMASYYSKTGMEYLMAATDVLNRGKTEPERAKGMELLEKSMQAYEMALKWDPSDGQLMAGLGAAQARAGKVREALASYEKGRSNFDSREMYNDIGNIYIDLSLTEKESDGKPSRKYVSLAESNYREAIFRDVNFDVAWSNLGNVLLRSGKFAEAAVAFSKALDIRGNSAAPPLLMNMGIASMRSGNLTAAAEVFARAHAAGGGFSAASSAAEMCASRGLSAEALKWADQAVGAGGLESNQKARLFHRLGTELGQAGSLEGAIAFLNMAIKADPTFVNSYIDIGVALGKAERMDEAVEALKKSLEVAPDHPSAHCNLAMAYLRRAAVYAKSNEMAEVTRLNLQARIHLNKCLSVDPRGYHSRSASQFLQRVDAYLERAGFMDQVRSRGEESLLKTMFPE